MAANEQYTIERYYAYSAARSNIECYCRLLGYNAAHRLEWDTARLISADADIQHDVAQAVAYLDSRTLLLRPHVDNPAIVVILPNDEERRVSMRADDMSIAA
jgi:TnpA family transposase